MHDESYQAMLLRRQREARKAYSASQELGDETEAQVEAVHFVSSAHDDYDVVMESSHDGECWFSYDEHARYQRTRHLPKESEEDRAQAEFLRNEGAWQERVEKAFCWGMMVGGATALTVLVSTLWILGVL